MTITELLAREIADVRELLGPLAVNLAGFPNSVLPILMLVVDVQGTQEVLKVPRLAEVAIDRGEAHVGDLIEAGERVDDAVDH